MTTTMEHPTTYTNYDLVEITEDQNGNEIRRYRWDEIITIIFDSMIETPHGITLDQLVEKLDLPEHVVRQGINKVRDMLADDGDTNIIAVPHGRERRYQLVNEHGTAVEGWATFNKKYVHSRIATIKQVYSTLVRAARTEEERDAAQRVLRQVQRLIEDVEDMEVKATRRSAQLHLEG